MLKELGFTHLTHPKCFEVKFTVQHKGVMYPQHFNYSWHLHKLSAFTVTLLLQVNLGHWRPTNTFQHIFIAIYSRKILYRHGNGSASCSVSAKLSHLCFRTRVCFCTISISALQLPERLCLNIVQLIFSRCCLVQSLQGNSGDVCVSMKPADLRLKHNVSCIVSTEIFISQSCHVMSHKIPANVHIAFYFCLSVSALSMCILKCVLITLPPFPLCFLSHSFSGSGVYSTLLV